jgi:peptidoglycan hydrolase CwlO-like protein
MADYDAMINELREELEEKDALLIEAQAALETAWARIESLESKLEVTRG